MTSSANERRGRLSFWLGLAIAIGCAVYATCVRFGDLDAWNDKPDIYFPGGVPAMTTADAYYPLRWARAFVSGTYRSEADDPLRRHQTLQLPVGASEFLPDDSQLDWRARREPKRLPGLSWMLATLAPIAGSVEHAGLYLIPVLANLFMIPMFLYGWRIGWPAAGLMGGLVATFSIAYYARTSLGWVDTDCLNLLFPWTASLLVLCIGREQRRSTALLLSAALGITLFLYFRWYERPAFAYLYWATLVAHMTLQRMRPGTIALCLATCVLFSHPLQAAMGADNVTLLVSRYVFEAKPTADSSLASRWFPDVMQTVGELRHGDWREAFASILSNPSAALIGLASFAVLALARWRLFVPLLPLIAIGGLALFRGTRFAMYLAPFVGMGLGVLIEIALRGFMAPRKGDERTAQHANGRGFGRRVVATIAPTQSDRRALVAYAAVLVVFFAGLKPMTGIGHFGPPAVPPETVTALRELGRKLPPGTPLWTWWDYGYAIPYLASLATYHDGGGQFTPQTNVVANSLVVADEAAIRNTALFVERYGNKGIDGVAREVETREALLARIARYTGSPEGDRDIHVLFTSNMVGIFASLRFAAGLPVRNERGELLQYESLTCSAMRSNTLRCEGFDIDLSTGTFSDGRMVGKLVVVADGHVVKTLDYPHASGFVLQVLADPQGRSEVVRLPEEVYRSNFNRMFLLGQYDPALFEEVYRRYPLVRVYRIRG